MIRRNEVLLPAVWGKEQRGCRVVPAVGEKLQSEKGVRRSTLAQIQLDRIRRPGVIARPHHDKVDGESAEHPLTGQSLADPLCIRADLLGVLEIRGKRASQVALP